MNSGIQACLLGKYCAEVHKCQDTNKLRGTHKSPQLKKFPRH